MPQQEIFSEIEEGLRLKVIVKPNSKKQKLIIDGALSSVVVSIKSSPEKGKANKELIKLLSKMFNHSTSAIHILTGHTSRDKIILLQDMTSEKFLKIIEKINRK